MTRALELRRKLRPGEVVKGKWRMTQRQQRALDADAKLRRGRDAAERIWLELIPVVVDVYDNRLYEEFGFTNFTAYCDEVKLSDSFLYSLVQIGHLAPRVQNKLAELGSSKAQLLIPQLSKTNDTRRQVELIEKVAPLTWADTRTKLKDIRAGREAEALDTEPPTVAVRCPVCHSDLLASRAVELRRRPKPEVVIDQP